MADYKTAHQFSDLIDGLNPTQIKAFKASKEQQMTLVFLIEKSKESPLNALEKEELDYYISLERFICLAKINLRDPSV